MKKKKKRTKRTKKMKGEKAKNKKEVEEKGRNDRNRRVRFALRIFKSGLTIFVTRRFAARIRATVTTELASQVVQSLS